MYDVGNFTNSTASPFPPSQVNSLWGFLAVIICGCSFGSASLPIKKFETGAKIFGL